MFLLHFLNWLLYIVFHQSLQIWNFFSASKDIEHNALYLKFSLSFLSSHHRLYRTDVGWTPQASSSRKVCHSHEYLLVQVCNPLWMSTRLHIKEYFHFTLMVPLPSSHCDMKISHEEEITLIIITLHEPRGGDGNFLNIWIRSDINTERIVWSWCSSWWGPGV